jgi:hypothetical protein
MMSNGDVPSPEENVMGWKVHFRPSIDRCSHSSAIVSSHPDALTHARMLLDKDRSGVVEVGEEGSKTVVIYRLIEREMVALGEVTPIGGQPGCWGAVRRRG